MNWALSVACFCQKCGLLLSLGLGQLSYGTWSVSVKVAGSVSGRGVWSAVGEVYGCNRDVACGAWLLSRGLFLSQEHGVVVCTVFVTGGWVY